MCVFMCGGIQYYAAHAEVRKQFKGVSSFLHLVDSGDQTQVVGFSNSALTILSPLTSEVVWPS